MSSIRRSARIYLRLSVSSINIRLDASETGAFPVLKSVDSLETCFLTFSFRSFRHERAQDEVIPFNG